MEFARLGNSGLKASRIGLGCGSATFAARADENTAIRLVHQALELGINYIDTAETYAEGRSETLIGKAIAGRRSQLIIATKFAKDRSVRPDEQRGSRTRIMKAVEGSLRRLGTDYIDLYIMHEPDPETPIEETLATLHDLARAGKVRYIGSSDFAGWQMCEALWTSRTHRFPSFICSYLHHNLIHRDHDPELMACCAAYGLGIVPTHPLADGFLTGKYRRGEQLPQGARLTHVPEHANPKHQNLARYDHLLNDRNFDKLARLEGFARERGHTVGELAIAWLLAQPLVGIIPVGVSGAEQLKLNVAAANWKLSGEDVAHLNKLL